MQVMFTLPPCAASKENQPKNIIGVCLRNTDTYDKVEHAPPSIDEGASDDDHQPYDVTILANFDFTLRPNNLHIGFKTLRCSKGLDWDDISTW